MIYQFQEKENANLIIDSVGTLVIKIKILKTNLIADDSETDETIIMHKVSV
jgi:hypothetical protein